MVDCHYKFCAFFKKRQKQQEHITETDASKPIAYFVSKNCVCFESVWELALLGGPGQNGFTSRGLPMGRVNNSLLFF